MEEVPAEDYVPKSSTGTHPCLMTIQSHDLLGMMWFKMLQII